MRNSSAEHAGALALVSGGLDSTVAVALAANRYRLERGIFFHYGQLAARREYHSARTIGEIYNFELLDVDISWLGTISHSAITGGGMGRNLSEENHLYVENRNGVFLNIAAAFAVAGGEDVVIAGFNRQEAVRFPDNSREYLNTVNRSLQIGAGGKLRVESPTIDMNKRQIVEEGLRLDIPWRYIWSCYLGGGKMCGRCRSCINLKGAVEGTGAEGRIYFER